MRERETPVKKKTRYSQFVRKLFPSKNFLDFSRKIMDGIGKITDEDLFVAFLKLIGFHKTKFNYPEAYKKQYHLQIGDNERCYTLSGGPMVIFTNKGEFLEWS